MNRYGKASTNTLIETVGGMMSDNFDERVREYERVSLLRMRVLNSWDWHGHDIVWVALKAPSFPIPPKITLMCACDFTVEAILPTGFELTEDDDETKKLPSNFGYRLGSSSLSCFSKEQIQEQLRGETRKRHRERWSLMTPPEQVRDIFLLSRAETPMGQQYADELAVWEIAGILDVDLETAQEAVDTLEAAGVIRPETIGSVFYIMTHK